jgi:hypothetical protein
LSWLGSEHSSVETMSELIAAIMASAWCGLGAITAKLPRDFFDPYAFTHPESHRRDCWRTLAPYIWLVAACLLFDFFVLGGVF